MAWKAYIENVEANQGPTDSLGVNVKFVDAETNRSLVRWYKLASYGATLEDLRAVVRDAIEKLEAFDVSARQLELMAGQEIS